MTLPPPGREPGHPLEAPVARAPLRAGFRGVPPPLLLAAWAASSPVNGNEALAPAASSPESSRNPLVEAERESQHMTGDWGGWRARLVERGVHFQAGYLAETFSNVSGGIRRGTLYEGLAEAALELDLESITGVWKGATLRGAAIFPHGASPSRELTGDALTLSNIDAYDSLALYELWGEQRLGDDRLSVRFGQLLADSEFTFTGLGGSLLNSTFGWPAFISANTRNSGPAYYRAAPGVRVRAEPGAGLYVQGAIYDGDTFDRDDGRPGGNPHGTHFHLSGHQGAFVIGEVGWSRPSTTNDHALAGTYKVGAWLHTGEFADVRATGRSHGSNHGFYFAAEQMFSRESGAPGQGLGAFARFGVAPSDRNFVALGWDVGLQYRGLLPGRDGDTLTLGVAGIEVSHEVRRAERESGAAIVSDREIVIELTYQWQIRPWLAVQPDVQWIHHPGASRALDTVLALGCRTRLTF